MLQASVQLPRFDGFDAGRIENVSHYISKDQRYRGVARVTENNLVLNLNHVREALDAITLDGAEEVNVKSWHCRHGIWLSTYRGGNIISRGLYAYYTFKPAPDRPGRSPRVRITAPCGETRTYSVRLLDRMLSEFGA